MNGTDVVLVLMPFASLTHPSLALGCLTGTLNKAGISARNLYFNIDFAGIIGTGNYFRLSFSPAHADWVFSRAAFPDMVRRDSDFLREYPSALLEKTLLAARDAADRFIEDCVRQILALKPKIVGASSSFYQNCASLALLRRIRELAPEIATVIGGANCEGEMGAEMRRVFPWLDYIFSGEADEAFPEFCRAYLAGEKIANPERTTVADISDLPFPIFDDYFAALEQSTIREKIIPGLVLETARGCWWGAKKPCAFCGLNGLTQKQRVKSPERAYREIIALTKRHGVKSVQLADNMVVPSHIEHLLPRFADSGLQFMYEVPATLTREQLRKLSDSGVRRMQPGIEQLNDKSLEMLGKPNRLIHNLRFLKWSREYGIGLAWNCLYGFPGEDDAWHGEAAELIPLITHLQPPTAAVEIRFYRFSPYFNEQSRHGISLKPMSYYSHVYPLDEDSMSRLAYFFEAQGTANARNPGRDRLIRAVREWKELFLPIFVKSGREPPVLAMTVSNGEIMIKDTRPIAHAPNFLLSGIKACVYTAADEGKTAAEIAEILYNRGFAADITVRDAEEILRDFIETRLMIKLGEKYLSLAVAAPFREYPAQASTPGGWFRREENIKRKEIKS